MAYKNLEITAVNGYTNQDPYAIFIPENIQTGTVVGKVSGWVNGEDLSQVIFAPNTAPGSPADDQGRFEIVQAAAADPNGQWAAGDWIVVIKSGEYPDGSAKFNWENQSAFANELNFNVTFQAGYTPQSTYGCDYIFNVENINEAPTNVAISADTITENAAGVIVGDLSAYDDDDFYWVSQSIVNYSIVPGLDGAHFQITAGGQLQAVGALDYEASDIHTETSTGKRYYDVIVRASDTGEWGPNGESPSGTPAYSDKTFRVYVNNDPSDDLAATPVVQFDSASLAITQAEGNSGATAYMFTIARSGADLSGSSTVNWAVTGTGANPANGADFGGTLPAGSVTFAAGEVSKTITVNVSGDTAFESAEQFLVTLTAGTNSALGTNTSATGTITNDDVAPVPPALSINDMTVTEGNGGTGSPTLMTFTVTRTGDTSGTSSVDWALAHGTTAAGDFVVDGTHPLSGTVNFGAGETSKTIVLQVNGDTSFEPTETFSINLSNAGNATISDGTGAGTITNDDVAPTPVVQFSSPAPTVSHAEGNSGTVTYTYFVIRDTTVGSSTVNWAVTGSGANPADGADFGGTLPSGQVTFADGENVKQFDVTVSGDTVVEATEQFTVTLSAGTNSTINANNVATGTITNDDAALPPPALSINDMTVTEGNGGTGSPTLMTFTVTRTGDTSGSSSVDWALAHGTTAAGDFVVDGTHPLSGTVNFGAGETSKTIVLQVNGDTSFEPNETFSINLSNAGNATISDGTGAGTITNDDVAPPVPVFSIVATEAVKAEGDSGFTELTFSITRTGDTSAGGTVKWTVEGTGDHPAATGDFIAGFLSNVEIFDAGQATKQITIRVAGDLEWEADETFHVVLSEPTNGTISVTQGAADGAIADDDRPLLSIASQTGTQVAEGDAGMVDYVFRVFRDKTGAPSSATWTVSGMGIDAGDFEALTGTVDFAADQQFKDIVLKVKSDKIEELNETFTITLSDAVNARLGSQSAATGTIVNDDHEPTFQVVTGQDYFTGTQGVAIDGVLAGVDLDDADGDPLTLTVSFTDANGALNGMSTGGGVTVTDLGTNPNGIHSYKLEGSASAIETLLSTASFTPAHGNETTSFSFTLTDGFNPARAYGDRVAVLGEFAGNHAPARPSGTFDVHESSGQDFVVVDTLPELDDEGTVIDYTFFGAQDGSFGKVSGDGRFKIVNNQIVVNDPSKLDVNVDSQQTYVVLASDGTYTVQGGLTITVRNNLAPAISAVVASGNGEAGANSSVVVKETAGAGEIAMVTAVDQDAARDGRALHYSLASTYNGLFAIDDAGKISIADASKLPVAADTPYQLQVIVSDGSDTTTQAVTVEVKDVNVAPGPISPTVFSVREYTSAGVVLGALSATDPDGDALSYSLVDSAGGRVKLVGNQLVVDNGFLFDFEQSREHKVTVQVSDGKGGAHNEVVTINVADWGPEIIGGTSGNDVFYGGATKDKIYGGAGNDRLFGGANVDIVKGLAGNDTIGGGAGKDKLFGGKGKFSKDMFVFDTKLTSPKVAKKNVDKIYDFGPKYDSLGFDDLAFTNKTIARYVKKKGGATLDHALKIDKNWFRVGDKAIDKNDFFIWNDKTHKLYFDVDGSGHKAMVEVASFAAFEKKAGLALTFKDFFLI